MADLPAVGLTPAGFTSVVPATTHIARIHVPLPPLDSPKWQSSLPAFAWGMRSVTSTVLTLVLFATYLGIGALAHDTHFSLAWALASTAFVWAGPAQIILISTLGSGATLVQAAIAVTVSAIRLFPMVVSVPADDTHTTDKTASSGAGDAFHRGHLVGRMLSAAATGAARAPDRFHPWSRHRSCFRLPRCQCDWLQPRSQSAATVCRRGPAADAAGVSAFDRAQLSAVRRHPGAGIGIGA